MKVKLSVAVRTTITYLRMLFIGGIILFMFLGAIYILQELKEYRELADEIVVKLERNGLSVEEISKETTYKDIYVSVYEHKDRTKPGSGEEIAGNYPQYIKEKRFFLDKVYISVGYNKTVFMIKSRQELFTNSGSYDAVFCFDITNNYKKMLGFIKNAALAYIVMTALVLILCYKENEKIFRPLTRMSNTAKNMTIANLERERMDLTGARSEIYELGEVFNEMLDRLQLSYESQKQFVSDASHELRTPIAIIQGYTGMLKRWGSTEQDILEESIDAIHKESKSMQDLVEKLLFLSRHDKKTLKLEKARFSMSDVIEEMVRETKMVNEDRIISAPVIQKINVYGDEQSLKQAFRIFIDNAVKYSGPGDEISISCENKQGDCVVTIADTGIGMMKKDVEKIFNRFYRSDDVRGKRIEGHGLGLSIAKLIIQAHAGTIKIRTQYTKGTTITVTIPKARLRGGENVNSSRV